MKTNQQNISQEKQNILDLINDDQFRETHRSRQHIVLKLMLEIAQDLTRTGDQASCDFLLGLTDYFETHRHLTEKQYDATCKIISRFLVSSDMTLNVDTRSLWRKYLRIKQLCRQLGSVISSRLNQRILDRDKSIFQNSCVKRPPFWDFDLSR